MVYACNFQESLPNVDAILDTPVKYATIKLAVFKATSTTKKKTNANLVQDAMRITSCSLERNATVLQLMTTCVFQSKSANPENL